MSRSFVTATLNPCLVPSSVTVSSMRLGLPSTLFTTACSNPEDFVNTSTDFSDALGSWLESASPAPVSVAARRNSLRLETAFTTSLSVMSFRMLAARKTGKYAVRRPAQLSHSYFRGVVRYADPPLQVFKVFAEPCAGFPRICALRILFRWSCCPSPHHFLFLPSIPHSPALPT